LRALDTVEDRESQFQLVYRALGFVQWVSGDGVDREFLGGECVKVRLKVS